MGKYAILAGVLMAALMMVQLDKGESEFVDDLKTTVINTSVLEDDEEEPDLKIDGYHKPLNLRKVFYNNIYTGLGEVSAYSNEVSAVILEDDVLNARDIAEFFERLKKTQEVETFVLIAENRSWQGAGAISLSAYGYDTPFGKVNPDLEILENLLKLDEAGILERSYWAFKNESSVSIYAPFIAKSFPEAKVVPIVLKDFAGEEQLELLADYLAELDDVVLVAGTRFSFAMDSRVSDFQNELVNIVFASFDKSGIERLNVDSKPVLLTLMNYVEKIGALEMGEYEHGRVFYDGKGTVAERPLTILAFGDMMMGRYVRTLMDDNGGKDYVFEDIKGYEWGLFKGSDIVHANLEGPIKGAGKKGGTAMVFSFNEDIAGFLKSVGFNLVSLANNHAVDQGWDGRDTTIVALDEAGVGWCGHPKDADPGSVKYGNAGGTTYAFVCLHDVTFKLDDAAAVTLIQNVSADVDHVIVSIHWGYEYKHTADWGTQVEPGRAFIDAGADLVIGHHPHVVENFEVYNGKLIFYSLGNFVFDQYWSQATQEELAIGVVMGKDSTRVHLFPMKSELSQSRLMTENERTEWIERFIEYGDYTDEMKEMIRTGVIEI